MRKILIFPILFVILIGITIPESYAAPGDWSFNNTMNRDGMELYLQFDTTGYLAGQEIGCLIQMAYSIVNGGPFVYDELVIEKPIIHRDSMYPIISDNRLANLHEIVFYDTTMSANVDVVPDNKSPIFAVYDTQYVKAPSPITTVYAAGMFMNNDPPDIQSSFCATPQDPIAKLYDGPSISKKKRIVMTDSNMQDPEMPDIERLFRDFSDQDNIMYYDFNGYSGSKKVVAKMGGFDINKANMVILETALLKISPGDANPQYVASVVWGIEYKKGEGIVAIPITKFTDPTCKFLTIAKVWNNAPTTQIQIPGIPAVIVPGACNQLPIPVIAAPPLASGAAQRLLPTTPSAAQQASCCGACAVQ